MQVLAQIYLGGYIMLLYQSGFNTNNRDEGNLALS
jgi:hypothetical protein